MIYRIKNLIFAILMLLLSFGFLSCHDQAASKRSRVLHAALGGGVKTLDPALASDFGSQNMTGNFYDTLLQYDYLKRPYVLKPSMLQMMPKVNNSCTVYEFTLRDDLFFVEDTCFKITGKSRKVTSKDVKYSILRIADARLRSPVYWMFRDKIIGLDDFYRKTALLQNSDIAVYNEKLSGFEIIDDRSFRIKLLKPDPRLLYIFALPNAGIVSSCAVKYYKNNLSDIVVGSGPFELKSWQRNYKIIFDRNNDFREEYFSDAKNMMDRNRKLPLLDRVEYSLVKQPLASWLLFLQGELDLSSLSKDNFDAVVDDNLQLVSSLKERGIKTCS